MGALKMEMPPEFKAMQAEMQADAENFKKAQGENQKLVGQRTQLHQQISENQMVEKELKMLEDEAKVFKLVGPVLIPQDLIEAKANVKKRLEYMQGETDKIDKKMKENNELMEKTQQKVMDIQKKMQKAAQEQAQKQQQQ